jgi:PRTRC genetic system ThiF family protein
MQIEPRYRINLGTVRHLTIYLIGCGGTGSFAALHVARLAYHWRERMRNALSIVFVDPDVVERKNVGRQNFCPAEIGQHKAHRLMVRYNAAFGLSIECMCDPLEDVEIHTQHKGIMIGCVDNHTARQEMHRQVARLGKTYDGASRLWWLDAGNHENAGQVLLGNEIEKHPTISPLSFCTGTPSPAIQGPELLLPPPLELASAAGESCAELTARDAQSLMVNQACAGWIGVYLSRLIISQDLDVMATYFDLGTCAARSDPITGTPPEPPAAREPANAAELLWGEDDPPDEPEPDPDPFYGPGPLD